MKNSSTVGSNRKSHNRDPLLRTKFFPDIKVREDELTLNESIEECEAKVQLIVDNMNASQKGQKKLYNLKKCNFKKQLSKAYGKLSDCGKNKKTNTVLVLPSTINTRTSSVEKVEKKSYKQGLEKETVNELKNLKKDSVKLKSHNENTLKILIGSSKNSSIEVINDSISSIQNTFNFNTPQNESSNYYKGFDLNSNESVVKDKIQNQKRFRFKVLKESGGSSNNISKIKPIAPSGSIGSNINFRNISAFTPKNVNKQNLINIFTSNTNSRQESAEERFRITAQDLDIISRKSDASTSNKKESYRFSSRDKKKERNKYKCSKKQGIKTYDNTDINTNTVSVIEMNKDLSYILQSQSRDSEELSQKKIRKNEKVQKSNTSKQEQINNEKSSVIIALLSPKKERRSLNDLTILTTSQMNKTRSKLRSNHGELESIKDKICTIMIKGIKSSKNMKKSVEKFSKDVGNKDFHEDDELRKLKNPPIDFTKPSNIKDQVVTYLKEHKKEKELEKRLFDWSKIGKLDGKTAYDLRSNLYERYRVRVSGDDIFGLKNLSTLKKEEKLTFQEERVLYKEAKIKNLMLEGKEISKRLIEKNELLKKSFVKQNR